MQILEIKEKDSSFCAAKDYYTLKSFLELKQKTTDIFKNKERANNLKTYIKEQNNIKDDLVKIANDENYLKALGLNT